MPKMVVDLLKVVDVQHDDDVVASVLPKGAFLSLQYALHRSAVVELRHRVPIGLVQQIFIDLKMICL